MCLWSFGSIHEIERRDRRDSVASLVFPSHQLRSPPLSQLFAAFRSFSQYALHKEEEPCQALSVACIIAGFDEKVSGAPARQLGREMSFWSPMLASLLGSANRML